MTSASNKSKKILICMLSVVLVFIISIMISIPVYAAGVSKKASITPAVANNKKYDLTNPLMKKWLKKNKIMSVEWWGDAGENSYPNKVTLKWKTKKVKKSDSHFVFLLSENPDLKKAKKVKTTDKFIELDNLYTNTTYYWQVYLKGNKHVSTPIQKFRTKQGYRTINMPGVSNVRDLGGRKVPGGMIKQGMLYRSGMLNNVTPKGRKVATKDLKIKTDFDLRNRNRLDDGVVGPSSPLGSKVRYINLSGTQYLKLWETELDKRIITSEMNRLAQKSNYPLVFHCKIGRDRTGTLSFLVSALLGVSKLDLLKEYDLSFFSVDGCAKTAKRVNLIGRVLGVYNQIDKYGRPGDKFSKKTELFLRDMGVTKRNINNIKTILLEKKDEADR